MKNCLQNNEKHVVPLLLKNFPRESAVLQTLYVVIISALEKIIMMREEGNVQRVSKNYELSFDPVFKRINL